MGKQKWKIYLGISVGLISLGLTYFYFFGVQTFAMAMLRWEAREEPIIWMTPQELHDRSVALTSTKLLSFSGYEFRLPWNDFDEAHTRSSPTRTVLAFESNKTVVVYKIPPHEFSRAVVEQMGVRPFVAAYGSAPMESDYAMWKLLAETTPAKIRLRSTPEETARIGVLITIKAISAPAKTGIFDIRSAAFQGFQWGDPAEEPKRIVLDLYDSDGGIEMVISGAQGSSGMIVTQPELNLIAQSIRRSSQDKVLGASTPNATLAPSSTLLNH